MSGFNYFYSIATMEVDCKQHKMSSCSVTIPFAASAFLWKLYTCTFSHTFTHILLKTELTITEIYNYPQIASVANGCFQKPLVSIASTNWSKNSSLFLVINLVIIPTLSTDSWLSPLPIMNKDPQNAGDCTPHWRQQQTWISSMAIFLHIVQSYT